MDYWIENLQMGNDILYNLDQLVLKIWGKEVAILWAGEIFWEIALLGEEERTATIKAKTRTELIILNQESLIEMINSGNESINKDIMERLELKIYLIINKYPMENRQNHTKFTWKMSFKSNW